MAKNFYRTVTLASANTNYNLYTLMAAIDPNVGRNFMQLQIIAPAGNSNNVSIGWGGMSALSDGDEMFPTSSRNFDSGGGRNEISVTDKFVRSDGVDQKLFIRGMLH